MSKIIWLKYQFLLTVQALGVIFESPLTKYNNNKCKQNKRCMVKWISAIKTFLHSPLFYFQGPIKTSKIAEQATTKKRKHQCDICGFKFAKKANLVRHYKIHTDRKKNQHKCTVCGKSFSRQDNLKAHVIPECKTFMKKPKAEEVLSKLWSAGKLYYIQNASTWTGCDSTLPCQANQ